MIDLDNFKQINDNYSHAAGDIVLKEVAQIFLNNTLDDDLVVRYGGDEFLIVVNDGIDNALKTAEKIRNEIDTYKFKYNDNLIHITVTIGIKEFDSKDDIEHIIDNADFLMYSGKMSGKNKIVRD